MARSKSKATGSAVGRGLESLLEGSGRSELAMWRDGVVLALLPVIYGLFPLISGVVNIRSRRGAFHLEGMEARALGLAAIALGAALHVHFFWASHKTLSDHYGAGMIASAAVFLGSIAYILLF
jgi:hypothetical protein